MLLVTLSAKTKRRAGWGEWGSSRQKAKTLLVLGKSFRAHDTLNFFFILIYLTPPLAGECPESWLDHAR